MEGDFRALDRVLALQLERYRAANLRIEDVQGLVLQEGRELLAIGSIKHVTLTTWPHFEDATRK